MGTTLGDLITLVQQRSNQENNTATVVSELTTYINNSLAELYDILTTTYEDYDSHTYNAMLTGSTNTIPLLSDVNKVRLVEFKYIAGAPGQVGDGTDNYYPIQQFQMPQRNRYGNTPLNIFLPYQLALVTYRVMGNQILIEPLASSNGEYRIWYSQKWQNLVNLTDFLPDNIDCQAWSEYAVVDCCIKIFGKLGLDTSNFRQDKAELKDRIISAAKNRTLGSPKVMINVRRRNRFGGSCGWGPGGMF